MSTSTSRSPTCGRKRSSRRSTAGIAHGFRSGTILFSAVALLALLALVTLATAGAAGADEPASRRAAAGAGPASPEGPEIAAVVPDPWADSDDGESVVLRFPRGRNGSGWRVTDGEGTVALPARRLHGTVNVTDGHGRPVRDADIGGIGLANGGDRVALVAPTGEVVDAVGWGDEGAYTVGEGERLVRRDRGGWRATPVGGTDRDVARFHGVDGTAFVAPHGTREAVTAVLRNASSSVHVAGYSFDSDTLADRLVALHRRGVTVRVLVEGRPAGGFERDDRRVLRRLARAGVDVWVAVGERRRYDFLHAKYLVADDAAVVTTQNWGAEAWRDSPRGSRGWGVVLRDPAVADELRALFRADADWPAVERFRRAAPRLDVVRPKDGDGRPPRPATASTGFDDVTVDVVAAPDRGVEPIARFVRNATESLRIQQAYVRRWQDRRNPFVAAAFDAARRGADVRILLDGRWFVAEENRRVVERLNARAEERDLPLEARLADAPVHTKGVVADGDAVLVSSVNWNRHSPRENRELGVIVRDREAARTFAAAFDADWRGAGPGIPLGEHATAVLALALLGLAGAALAWRGLR